MKEQHIYSAIYSDLKPICDSIFLTPNPNNIESLVKLLDRMPPHAVMKLQSYILVPIEKQLRHPSNTKIKQVLVEALMKIIKLSSVDSDLTLLRLSTLLVKQIVVPGNETTVAKGSEELKLSVVECLYQVWKSAQLDTLYAVCSRNYHSRLSPIVFILIQLAKNEQFIKLRVTALKCLLIICQVHGGADPKDVELRQKARNVVMLMLPGIVSCCASISAEPATINHKIIVANIRLWSRVVSLVMDDSEAAEPDADPNLAQPPPAPQSEQVLQILQQRRTQQWLQDTAGRLSKLTESMLRAQTHTQWKVRQQLAYASHLLLTTCSRNMSSSVGSLVCCLLGLSEDTQDEVKVPAEKALAALSRQFEQDGGQSLLDHVETTFYNLLTRAPRVIEGTDSEKLAMLSLLVGCLRLQGAKLPQVLASATFLNRLLVTLLHIARLDSAHVSLLEDCSIKEIDGELEASQSPWRQFTYCNSPESLGKLQSICRVLREYAGLHTITHALLEFLDSDLDHNMEAILLLNFILAGEGADSMKEPQQADLVLSVAGVYLQPNLWDVPFTVTQQDQDIQIVRAQKNIIQVALLAEGLGKFAEVVGAQHFSPFLRRCLYPLLECAGSPLYPLSCAGLMAVRQIAVACVGGGVTELVQANVDYLSHHITLKLRRAQENPGVLSVLSVVMRQTTEQVLPSLHEIVEDVLLQSFDEFQESSAVGFLRVFLTYLECLRGWWSHADNSPSDEETPVVVKKSLVEDLLEYKRNMEMANNFDDEDPVPTEITENDFKKNNAKEEEEAEASVEEEGPKQVDPSIKLAVDVLERALHFLPSKDEQRQILVLDILKEGVLVLKNEEDQLLPVVHKIWSPLVERFQSSPIIVHRAFLLLCTLGHTAKDFIRQRCLEKVIPNLHNILTSYASRSVLKDTGSAYRLTQMYKLQRALLSGLGRLASDLNLQEKELHELLKAASPYLNTYQPRPLQELCCQLFRDVAVSHPTLVWIELLSLWSPTNTFEHSSGLLPTIKIASDINEPSLFEKNVSELLETFIRQVSQ